MIIGEDPTRVKKRIDIKLTIYDLVGYNAQWLGLGAFHSGVAFENEEWAYGKHDRDTTGVWKCRPRGATNFKYRCTIGMGQVFMSLRELHAILDQQKQLYPGNEYSLTSKNCNHFTESFCQALLGKSIPGWINRLANWGDAISGIIPNGGKQIEAGHDGAMTNTTAAIILQRSGSNAKDREVCLSDSELLVLARVESTVLRVLHGVPEQDPAAFSQTMMAMCWPFSSSQFTSVLLSTMDSLSSFCLSEPAFEQLSCLSWLALCTIAATGDYLACLELATAASRLFYSPHEEKEVHLHQQLRAHDVWTEMSAWNGMFFDGLAVKLQKQAHSSPPKSAMSFEELDEQELETKEVVFSELTLCVHLMSSFGVENSNLSGFLYEIQAVMKLEPARMQMLHQLLDYRSPVKFEAKSVPAPTFEQLKTAFEEVDTSGGGLLALDELSEIVRKLYEAAGRSRSAKAVRREVQLGMEALEVPADGQLGLGQFANMLTQGEFKLPWASSEEDAAAEDVQEEEEEEEIDVAVLVDPVLVTHQLLTGSLEGLLGVHELVTLHSELHNPLHVVALSTLLSNTFDQTPKVELPWVHFCHLSTVLASVLSFCHGSDDFESANRVLQTSFAITIAAHERQGQAVSMTESLRWHPFWQQLRFWRWLFQCELQLKKQEMPNDEQPSFESDGLEDPKGQMAFTTLNKVVQYMMSLQVPKECTSDLAKQLIATGQFNLKYVTLVQEMIQFVEPSEEVTR
eukprot:TRINITY_DN1072_c0_g3_i1.p1 TRINITY_DN1072_c0_g3~~TRINITY_DN1072_c0_g3_i1.p1  ORF type:complete len:740 (-),score=193.22 TRINITY_DN1072_c0_g3_i1:55-2274(-)